MFGQPADGAWKWKIVLRCVLPSLEESEFGKSKRIQADEENRLLMYYSRLIRKEEKHAGDASRGSQGVGCGI